MLTVVCPSWQKPGDDLSVDIGLICGTTDPMPPIRGVSWGRHPPFCPSLSPSRYMSFLIYIAVYIYSRRRLTSPTTWCQSRRITAFTDLCGRQHNSWYHPRPQRTRRSRRISWGRHTSSVCPFSRDRNHTRYILPYIIPKACLLPTAAG